MLSRKKLKRKPAWTQAQHDKKMKKFDEKSKVDEKEAKEVLLNGQPVQSK